MGDRDSWCSPSTHPHLPAPLGLVSHASHSEWSRTMCITPGWGAQCPSCLPHVFQPGFQGQQFQSSRTKWWTQWEPRITTWRRAILERYETYVGLFEKEMFTVGRHRYWVCFHGKLAWTVDWGKQVETLTMSTLQMRTLRQKKKRYTICSRSKPSDWQGWDRTHLLSSKICALLLFFCCFFSSCACFVALFTFSRTDIILHQFQQLQQGANLSFSLDIWE